MMVLGRILGPNDFGLVGMVTAVTGVLSLFRDFGLSTASIQKSDITKDQHSALFWLNTLIGVALCCLCALSSPLIAAFYREPKLVNITLVLSAGFVFNAAGIQHIALLQRQLRFVATTVIEIMGLVASVTTGIVMAATGFGYWALAAMAVAAPLVSTTGAWLATRWIPGPPRLRAGIRSLVKMGGTITLNGLVVYIAYNLDKVLIGRFWGANAIGIYGRAYQLINIPNENLNTAIGGVAFSALSRLQDQPERLKTYFLKGYSLVLAVTIPIAVACGLFAEDIIFVAIGPKWRSAVPVFRLLAPTTLVFALINPMSWLAMSLGLAARSLKTALVLSPVVILGYLAGLRHGPEGVAAGFSIALSLWAVPHIAWFVHGTVVTLSDVLGAACRPLIAGIVAGACAFGCMHFLPSGLWAPLVRLSLGTAVLLTAYAVVLLWFLGQKDLYFGVLRGALGKGSPT